MTDLLAELEPSATPEDDEAEQDKDAPSEQLRPLEDHPELVNLAEGMDPEQLAEIGALVVFEFEADLSSRQQWEEQQALFIRLAAQTDKPVNPPWQGSSDESLPILAEANNQFHSRCIKAFFPTNDIIKGMPIGHVTPEAMDQADRVGKHMSWQCMVQDRGYFRNKDRLFGSVGLHGSFFTKTYRDPIRHRNRVDNVRATDFVVPYGTGPRDVEDLERKTHVVWMDVRQTALLAQNKYFCCPAEAIEVDDTPSKVQEAANMVSGQTEVEDGVKQAKILEQHRFLDLDKDDIEEPYIIWVDASSQKVLRIAIRWDVHAEDQPMLDINGQPIMGPDGQPILEHKRGDPSNFKEPVEYFTHYPYMLNPDGFYALGMGYLIGNPNKAINKLLRQTIDAGTLANTVTGLVSKRIGIKKGPLDIEMGKLNPIDASVEDIKKNIYMFEFKGANEGLVNTMKMLRQSTDRLAGSTEVLTGSPDKVMQPTTVAALIEQGLMHYTSVQNRLHNAWEQELDKLFRLNRIYLDQNEYFAINDLSGTKQGQIARSDYQGNMKVRPAVDPNQATVQQKIAQAEAEYKVLIDNPLVKSDPQKLWMATVRYLKAIGSDDIDQVLPKPPPPAPPKPDPELVKVKLELDSRERMKRAELEVQIELARIQAEVQLETAKQRQAPQAGDPGFPAQLPNYDLDPATLAPGLQGVNGQPVPAPQPGNGPVGLGGVAGPPHNPMVPPPNPQPV